jgi:hypothetical protein
VLRLAPIEHEVKKTENTGLRYRDVVLPLKAVKGRKRASVHCYKRKGFTRGPTSFTMHIMVFFNASNKKCEKHTTAGIR